MLYQKDKLLSKYSLNQNHGIKDSKNLVLDEEKIEKMTAENPKTMCQMIESIVDTLINRFERIENSIYQKEQIDDYMLQLTIQTNKTNSISDSLSKVKNYFAEKVFTKDELIKEGREAYEELSSSFDHILKEIEILKKNLVVLNSQISELKCVNNLQQKGNLFLNN